MRVALLSTYPPRACGIGTYSADLRSSLLRSGAADAVDVFAIVRNDLVAQAPEVALTIRQDERGDYRRAAQVANALEYDAVLIQHEYGIFGGTDGAFVLDFAEALNAPMIVTLHTVLSAPTPGQATVLQQLCAHAQLVHVMTNTAERFAVLNNVCKPDKIEVIAHGAPDFLLDRSRPTEQRLAQSKQALDIAPDRFVLSTFGLLSSGKGLEAAIKAVAQIALVRPDVLLVIAGQTHPEIVKNEGEVYRDSLEARIDELQCRDNVMFINRYLTDRDLDVILSATDLYLTPYRNREQIVSGALTFAVAAGLPVVSTAYYYAEDLLGSGAGRLISFDDPDGLRREIQSLVNDPVALKACRIEAENVAVELGWTAVGGRFGIAMGEAIERKKLQRQRETYSERKTSERLNTVPMTHLRAMVDDRGIIQHATGAVPNRSTGYCVDDVGRLAIVTQKMIDRIDTQPVTAQDGASAQLRAQSSAYWHRIRSLCLAYMLDATADDGSLPLPTEFQTRGMRNFAGYAGAFHDDHYAGDHVGRAIWGLGLVAGRAKDETVWRPALNLIEATVTSITADGTHLRPAAYALLGLAELHDERDTPVIASARRLLTQRLVNSFNQHSIDGWTWFEKSLTYDNARLSEALLRAGSRDGDATAIDIGLNSLHWLSANSIRPDGVVRLVGVSGLTRSNSTLDDPESAIEASGDEQPLDAAALAEAWAVAFNITHNEAYAERATLCFSWFLGNNRLSAKIGNLSTGGCHDGLGTHGVNLNQGAESTVAFVLAALTLDETCVPAPIRLDSVHL